MQEAEWLLSEDPGRMLAYLFPTRDEDLGLAKEFRPSDRKMRLFACACCRQVWPLLADERSRRAVEVAERYADGAATFEEVTAARDGTWPTLPRVGQDVIDELTIRTFEVELVALALGSVGGLIDNSGLPRWFSVSTRHAAAQAALLRDLVGNPGRPLVREHNAASYYDGPVLRAAHVTRTARSIARAAYEQRLEECRLCRSKGIIDRPVICGPDTSEEEMRRLADEAGGPIPCPSCRGQNRAGFLDPVILAVLADALEEAGCEEAAILGHLRGEVREFNDGGRAYYYTDTSGPQLTPARAKAAHVHARGCRPLDLVLGLG